MNLLTLKREAIRNISVMLFVQTAKRKANVMRMLNVIRERKSEDWRVSDSFLVDDRVENPEQALRNAVKDFMQSEDAVEAIKYAGGDFNWGDAIMSITDEYLMPHGLRSADSDAQTVFLNQDEVLFSDIQQDVFKRIYGD